jgi:hypothetical protein
MALTARAGVSVVGVGVAVVDSSAGDGDFFGDCEDSGVGDFLGDADFFGDGEGDARFFVFADLLSAFFRAPFLECAGAGEGLLFFFFEGVGVSLGFGVLLALFFCVRAFGFGNGDFSAAGDDFGFGVG